MAKRQRSQSSRGKIVTRWTFNESGLSLIVPVRIVDPYHEYDKTTFQADVAGKKLSHTDIHELEQLVKKHLAEKFSVNAKPYLYLEVSVPNEDDTVEYDEGGSGFRCEQSVDIKWSAMAVGTTSTGKTVHRSIPLSSISPDGVWDGSHHTGHDWTEGLPSTGKEKNSWQSDNTYHGLFVCTPTALSMLSILCQAFRLFGFRLASALGLEEEQETQDRGLTCDHPVRILKAITKGIKLGFDKKRNQEREDS